MHYRCVPKTAMQHYENLLDLFLYHHLELETGDYFCHYVHFK